MQKYKVTFLIDKKNNWIESYLLKSSLFKSSVNYDFKISCHLHEIKKQDIVFILAYTKVLNDDFLKENSLNLVVHESALPKGKGFSPVQWQILDGINTIPICLIEAAKKVDSGDIVYKDKFELSGHELYDEIRDKQASATLKIISDFLNIFPNFSREQQVGSETIYRKRNINDSELNVDKSLREQFNLLRICNNEEWPSFFILNGVKYFLRISTN